jgi:hypothetical protein
MKRKILKKLAQLESKYLYFKLYLWWNYTIKRNEFSKELDFHKLRAKNKKVPMNEIISMITWQRTIAHDLDNGTDIKSISINVIKKSNIAIF